MSESAQGLLNSLVYTSLKLLQKIKGRPLITQKIEQLDYFDVFYVR